MSKCEFVLVFRVFGIRMNAQQLKFKLKEAREAVTSGDMKEAIVLCRVG